ncbi:methylated-DNA-[protein]-cysteine S-methyltransferase [Candidatus Kinetoplastibacterium blastocrithidii TCC012E]|uniref:methylated-DNA--[protein]-cysteine S-methyltransferase n=1 Tax=Candidatus Kinetoplastidibacterium blastocrithidiae TCC012E TaxID=1208922 RepID=M1LCA7_9PROT|nr:methylated-DNA--[protein]-cysteine S-methyltransferase [Candidatus Kinetoplastibacterium blastocrithidii]AFZ83262.1 methylated-DNA-protein-cysteine S-methyltransferase [Candidatus Kinetoplastibacterium blastocrithidii (ex Strigomonas culicis)]AGF50078.1 methylated-DNA-[protein]-cysteine S-methyltransferase [Candidatus Kinetoplastibacterium blastocrithidii TCC012E]
MKPESEKMFYCFFKSPIGVIKLVSSNDSIIEVSFIDTNKISINNTINTIDRYILKLEMTPILKNAVKQLNQWFRKERVNFELPLRLYGTFFQKLVWESLKFLQFGSLISYKEFAAFIGMSKSYRAVSHAISQNPILILNPCHRVVSINTELSGFSGGLHRKQQLLNHEGHLYLECYKNSKNQHNYKPKI